MQQLLPEEAFRLYAVCARYPHNLAGQVHWEEVQPGVYRCWRGTDVIRVVVLRQLPQVDHNALWHLFSAVPAQVGYGVSQYRQHSDETSTLLQQLFKGYQREGLAMPYTMEDFRRDYVKEHLRQLTPEERLEGLSAEEILQRLPPEAIENFLKRRKNGWPLLPNRAERGPRNGLVQPIPAVPVAGFGATAALEWRENANGSAPERRHPRPTLLWTGIVFSASS